MTHEDKLKKIWVIQPLCFAVFTLLLLNSPHINIKTDVTQSISTTEAVIYRVPAGEQLFELNSLFKRAEADSNYTQLETIAGTKFNNVGDVHKYEAFVKESFNQSSTASRLLCYDNLVKLVTAISAVGAAITIYAFLHEYLNALLKVIRLTLNKVRELVELSAYAVSWYMIYLGTQHPTYGYYLMLAGYTGFLSVSIYSTTRRERYISDSGTRDVFVSLVVAATGVQLAISFASKLVGFAAVGSVYLTAYIILNLLEMNSIRNKVTMVHFYASIVLTPAYMFALTRLDSKFVDPFYPGMFFFGLVLHYMAMLWNCGKLGNNSYYEEFSQIANLFMVVTIMSSLIFRSVLPPSVFAITCIATIAYIFERVISLSKNVCANMFIVFCIMFITMLSLINNPKIANIIN